VATAVPGRTISTSGGGSIVVASGVKTEVAGAVVVVAVGMSACDDPQLTKSSVRKRYAITARERFFPVKRIGNRVIRQLLAFSIT
jgi:hypothetical protein